MESVDNFAAGYTEALDDLERLLQREVFYWSDEQFIRKFIRRKRGAIQAFKRAGDRSFGSEFTQTIVGSSTGPQDGLRRGTDS